MATVSEKCVACGKTAYAMEKLNAEGKVFFLFFRSEILRHITKVVSDAVLEAAK